MHMPNPCRGTLLDPLCPTRVPSPPTRNDTPYCPSLSRVCRELKVVPIPGHTPGSVAILYKDTFLFTGDSMHYSRVEVRQ